MREKETFSLFMQLLFFGTFHSTRVVKFLSLGRLWSTVFVYFDKFLSTTSTLGGGGVDFADKAFAKKLAVFLRLDYFIFLHSLHFAGELPFVWYFASCLHSI